MKRFAFSPPLFRKVFQAGLTLTLVSGVFVTPSSFANQEIGSGFPPTRQAPVPPPPSAEFGLEDVGNADLNPETVKSVVPLTPVKPQPKPAQPVVSQPQATQVQTSPAKENRPSRSQAIPQPTATSESASADEEEWVVHIRPGRSKTASADNRYSEIYESIPFRRSEYLANPSYRHDTTVEIMFGQMRPGSVQRVNLQERVPDPQPEFFQQNMIPRNDWSDTGSYRRFMNDPNFQPIPVVPLP